MSVSSPCESTAVRSLYGIGLTGISSTPAGWALKASCRSAWARRIGSGRSNHWLKSKNPDAPAVRREAEEDWGKWLLVGLWRRLAAAEGFRTHGHATHTLRPFLTLARAEAELPRSSRNPRPRHPSGAAPRRARWR
jgi:hypothetical protein